MRTESGQLTVCREMKIYFPEYKDALGKVDGAFSLELLKSAVSADLKALDENGIRQIGTELSLEDAAIAGQEKS